MDRDLMLELLAEANGKRAKNGGCEFGAEEKASVLLALPDSLLTIDEVSRVDVKERFLAVRTGRGELFLLALERVAGLKLQRAKKESAGF